MLKKKDFLRGVKGSSPITLGYIPIAMAFGLLARNGGISLLETGLLSLLVYAGASQFMALDLIAAGASNPSIILATLLLNLRHMVMSASLSRDLGPVDRGLIPFIAFGITDESFSYLSFNKEKLSPSFALGVNLAGYIVWCLATILGYQVGNLIPTNLQLSLGIGLYAMFAGLLTPQVRGGGWRLMTVLVAGISYTIIHYLSIFSKEWIVVGTIVISSLIASFLRRDKNE